jgi:hypothetical protein
MDDKYSDKHIMTDLFKTFLGCKCCYMVSLALDIASFFFFQKLQYLEIPLKYMFLRLNCVIFL